METEDIDAESSVEWERPEEANVRIFRRADEFGGTNEDDSGASPDLITPFDSLTVNPADSRSGPNANQEDKTPSSSYH